MIHELDVADLPPAVVAQARRCLLDLVGVAAAGTATELSRIIRDHAARHHAGGGTGVARLMFDGRPVSPIGAALAGGMTIDSIDAHDGHPLAKGHAGVAVLPALIALIDAGNEAVDGTELLSCLVVGYEVGTRAAIALHQTACDYHSSGAWNAVACAAVGARRLGLDGAATREALGIAEYHGPRAQMMRCIDHPTMLKDSSGWGAMAGVSAALLAADGFTGAPALTIEAPEVAELWADLGRRHRILEHYFKPYPVCRWAQPAVEAALSLCREHDFTLAGPGASRAIERIEVETFHEATRLATRQPQSTEQAQYSLPFAVAAAVCRGRLGAEEVTSRAVLQDSEIARLCRSMVLKEDPDLDARFPGERYARVRLVRRDGPPLGSPLTPARGDPERPLTDAELVDKYRTLSEPVLGRARAAALQQAIEEVGRVGRPKTTAALIDELSACLT